MQAVRHSLNEQARSLENYVVVTSALNRGAPRQTLRAGAIGQPGRQPPVGPHVRDTRDSGAEKRRRAGWALEDDRARIEADLAAAKLNIPSATNGYLVGERDVDRDNGLATCYGVGAPHIVDRVAGEEQRHGAAE